MPETKAVGGKSILLIGDSYGTPRSAPCEVVLPQETWPQMLKEALCIPCEVDFQTYRCLVECADLVKQKGQRYDVIVLAAGIVDIFPRTLPYAISRSQNIGWKIFRKLVRGIRGFWAKNIRWKPWYTTKEVQQAVVFISEFCDTLILHTIPPLSPKHAQENVGAQAFLDEMNQVFRKLQNSKDHQIICLDIDALFRSKDASKFVDPNDSHYNVLGNLHVQQAMLALLQDMKIDA